MMKAPVIKVGEDIAVLVPKEIVTELGLKEGQELHVRRLDDAGFRIGIDDPLRDKALRIVDEATVKYAETLKALAKS